MSIWEKDTVGQPVGTDGFYERSEHRTCFTNLSVTRAFSWLVLTFGFRMCVFHCVIESSLTD
jgi:hypothetical protein